MDAHSDNQKSERSKNAIREAFMGSPAARWILAALITASFLWSIYDWTKLHDVVNRIHDLAYLLVAITISELFFTIGAIVMILEVGLAFGEAKGWLHLAHRARLSLRDSLSVATYSRLFGLGFWLNLIGAVGTSVLLAAGVIWLMPVASWGLVVLLFIDIIATLSWRIPVQINRRRARRASE